MSTPDRAPAGTKKPLIRRLWTTDLPAIEAHFLRLDFETRRDRFMHAMGDAAMSAYARRAVRADGLMFGLFVEGELRGVAELRPASARRIGTGLGQEAEAAFAIERPYRCAGLGTQLFRRLARAARNRAVRRLKVRCLAENRAMQALARKVGSDLVLAGFETSGELRLTDPTPLSIWQEGVEEGLDLTLAAASSLALPPHLGA
jgi:RimJ/RimL family protein N-acetyltransferase